MSSIRHSSVIAIALGAAFVFAGACQAAEPAKALTPQQQRMADCNKQAAGKSGDERYFLPRDKGPVRRFIRDFVDSRFGIVELMIPLLILTMVLGYSGNDRLAGIGNTVLFGTLLLVIVDLLVMRFRLRRQLAARFPDEPLKGTTYYAITRALQMKFMRLPKPQVKIGQSLPEQYK